MRRTIRPPAPRQPSNAMRTVKTSAIATVTVVLTLIAINVVIVVVVIAVYGVGKAAGSLSVDVSPPPPVHAVPPEWTPLQLEEKKRREATKVETARKAEEEKAKELAKVKAAEEEKRARLALTGGYDLTQFADAERTITSIDDDGYFHVKGSATLYFPAYCALPPTGSADRKDVVMVLRKSFPEGSTVTPWRNPTISKLEPNGLGIISCILIGGELTSVQHLMIGIGASPYWRGVGEAPVPWHRWFLDLEASAAKTEAGCWKTNRSWIAAACSERPAAK